MRWKKGSFKGKKIYVAVDEGGAPITSGGRTPIRYSSASGAKVYRAGASRIEVEAGAAIEDLDDGEAAGDGSGKKSRGSGFGSAGKRTAQQAAMAKDAAMVLLNGLGADVVRCYTDGVCRGNPGPAGSGALVELPDGRRGEGSLSLGEGTNNIGELSAVGLALDLLAEANVPPDVPVALLTDSAYSHGVLVRGWKAKANTELILALRARLKERPGLVIHWVAGHAGIAGNERADTLANRGVAGKSALTWSS